MSIRVLIADDEPLARQRLRRLLAEHPDLELVGEAAEGREALALSLDLRPELLLLDINMPELDGLACLEKLREMLPEDQRPLVVFTTAYEEHAVKAFELEGLDYLVKPLESEALARALRRVRRRGSRGDSKAAGGASPAAETPAPRDPVTPAASGPETPVPADPEAEASPAAATPLRYLAARKAGKILSLDLGSVAAIQLEDTLCYALTPGGRLRLKQSLAELESRLPSPPFLRVSRAAIVNLDWIAQLEPLFSGSYLATLRQPVGEQIQVSRRRSARLRELLGD